MPTGFGDFHLSHEMTTRVRFSLSYDPLKRDFIAFKMSFISIRNALLTRTLLSVTLRVRAKVLLHVSYDFYDTTFSTE